MNDFFHNQPTLIPPGSWFLKYEKKSPIKAPREIKLAASRVTIIFYPVLITPPPPPGLHFSRYLQRVSFLPTPIRNRFTLGMQARARARVCSIYDPG